MIRPQAFHGGPTHNATIGVLLAVCMALSYGAIAADVRVLCPSALRVPVIEAARSYSRASGHRVEFIFASVGATR